MSARPSTRTTGLRVLARRPRSLLTDPRGVAKRARVVLADDAALVRHRLDLRWKTAIRRAEVTDPVFVLTTARSGSNLARSLLNGLPGVTVANEVLHPRTYVGARGLRTSGATLAHLHRSLVALDGEVKGAKLFFSHLERTGISFADLRAAYPQARFIVLYRRNLWDQYLSTQRALRSGEWVRNVRDDPFERHKVHRPNRFDHEAAGFEVDEAALRRYFDEHRVWYEGALASEHVMARAAIVCYEQLADDPLSIMRTVAARLDLPEPHEGLGAGTRRQSGTEGDLPVVNLDELGALLRSPAATMRLELPT